MLSRRALANSLPEHSVLSDILGIKTLSPERTQGFAVDSSKTRGFLGIQPTGSPPRTLNFNIETAWLALSHRQSLVSRFVKAQLLLATWTRGFLHLGRPTPAAASLSVIPEISPEVQAVRNTTYLTSMLSAAFVAALVSSVAAIACAADPSCGLQYATMNTIGDVVGTVLYPASPEVCCANCTANPECQFFVTDDGGWRHIQPKCLLMSKAQTMNDYPHGSYGKNTVVIAGREVPAWGKCGDQSGFKLCIQGFYCQPWDSNYYQCIEKPSKCEVYTNVDLYGNDIKRIQGIKPGECCDECETTMGCVGYTYVNDDPRGTQCYLKKSVEGWTKKIGVHSGAMPNLPAWSKCGDYSGFRPCIDSFYCQPWDSSYYQCIERPRCYVETNIDYYGNDIKSVTGIGPGECCEECGKTPGCDSYTYINDDPSGTQCYLKSSNAGRTTKIGAVSGIVTPVIRST